MNYVTDMSSAEIPRNSSVDDTSEPDGGVMVMSKMFFPFPVQPTLNFAGMAVPMNLTGKSLRMVRSM